MLAVVEACAVVGVGGRVGEVESLKTLCTTIWRPGVLPDYVSGRRRADHRRRTAARGRCRCTLLAYAVGDVVAKGGSPLAPLFLTQNDPAKRRCS